MATETEELRLRITLDDSASAQLQRIQSDLSRLGGGPVHQSLGQVTAKATEAEKAFGHLTRSALGVGRATMDVAKIIGPMPVMLGVLGYEFIRQLAGMKEWAGQMTAINNAARMSGVSAGQFRGMTDQLRLSGVSAQEAAGMMQSLTRSISEAVRPGSQLRDNLIRMAGANANAMSDALIKLSEMTDATDRMNKIRQMGLDVYANNFNKYHDEMRARAAQLQFLQVFGLEKLINQKTEIARLDQRTLDNMNAEAIKQDALNAALIEEENTRNRIWNIIKGSMADYETAVTKILVRAEKWTDRRLETAEQKSREGGPSVLSQGASTTLNVLNRGVMGNAAALGAQAIENYKRTGRAFQHGGVVTKPTVGLVGESGPEAITPLTGISPRAASRAHAQSIGENTKQLRSLNDQLDRILGGASQSNISRYAAGMGGTGDGTGGDGTGTGPGSGYSRSSTDSTTGPTVPAPGTPGGVAVDMSSARMGMNKMWDDQSHPATGYKNLQEAIQPHFGAPRMQWPTQPGAEPAGVPTGGGSGIDRSQFVKEIQEKPQLKELMMRIAENEQGNHPEGTQAVIESAMNRAQVRGTSLEAQLTWHVSKTKGYYQKGSMGSGLSNPNTRAIIEQSYQNALYGNSNVSHYATDNASAGFAHGEIVAGSFLLAPGTKEKQFGGESLLIPGSAEAGYIPKWKAWVAAAEGRTPTTNLPETTPGGTAKAPFGGYGPFGQDQAAAASGDVGTGVLSGPAKGAYGKGANISPQAMAKSGVDPLLVESVQQGAIRAFGDPNDPNTRYVMQMQGGIRAQSTGLHGKGRAIDLQIFDRQTGQFVGGSSDIMKNAFGNPSTYRTYEIMAQARYQWALEKYGKETADKMSWGGRFGRSLEGSGPDEMHFSLGEGGNLGSITGAATGKYVGETGSISGWLAKHGSQASAGMGDVSKWRSPLLNSGPANTQVASAANAGKPESAWPDVADDTRGTLDRMMGNEVKHDVDTTGTITIKHDTKPDTAPKSKKPEFKDVPTNRQTQMQPAPSGPASANPAEHVAS